MAKINIEFDGKIYSVDENTLTSLASPLERALVQQLAGTGAVIRFGGNDYNVDANKLASTRNVLTDHLSTIAGTDSKVTVNGVEYGLSTTKLQSATDRMNETLDSMTGAVEPELPPSEGLDFSLNDDGQSYAVTGIGTCEDADIVIPDIHEGLPVTSIGEEAFSGIDHITTIIVSDSIESIGYNAIVWCINLESITIGANVRDVDSAAFWYNESLRDIYIKQDKRQSNLNPDQWDADEYPRPITDFVTIHWDSTEPESPEEPQEPQEPQDLEFTLNDDGQSYSVIGLRNEEVADLIIPATHEGLPVTSIGDYAFDDCSSLTSVTIPDSVTNIGEYAFAFCYNLTNVTIPDSVTRIKDSVFDGCESLARVTLGNSIESIGSYAFGSCGSLTTITIPESVTNIDPEAFYDSYELTTININQYEDESSLNPSEWILTHDSEYDEETGEETEVTIYLSEQATIIWKERI